MNRRDNPFIAAAVGQRLRRVRPHDSWRMAAEMVERLPSDSIPVSIIGGPSFRGFVAVPEVAEFLGGILAKNSRVVLITGATPEVCERAGAAFVEHRVKNSLLYHLVPKNHRGAEAMRGFIVEAGETLEQQQSVLAMVARLSVLLGGGAQEASQANLVLQSGGTVLPVACCGGAAAGHSFESDDALASSFDLELASQRFAEHLASQSYSHHWEVLNDPHGSWRRSGRVIYTYVEAMTESGPSRTAG